MSPFRAAHSGAETWRECVSQCAAQLGRPGGGLGFVYFTDHLLPHAQAMVDSLRESTGVTDWIGTVGLGVVASGIEYFDQPALVAMVADLPRDQYSIFSGRRTLKPDDPRYAGVIHADPETPDVTKLIADMSTKVDSGFLVGGLSSSRGRGVQVANDVISGGLSGALFAESVGMSTRLTQGCVPLPGRFRVTACDQNVISTLDGRPAFEVMKEAIGKAGEQAAGELRRAVQNLYVALPVAGSDRADYVVRNLVGIDPANGLIAIGELIEPGAELMFCRRDTDSARRDLGRILGVLREGTRNARGALYFSCIARGENMFGRRGAELEFVREALGDIPLAGFFCNGEISHDRLYSYTGVLTLFS